MPTDEQMAKPADPSTAPRDSSNLTLALTIGYVRSRRGPAAVERLLELAGEQRPLRVLEDEAGWSTQEQKVRLFEAAVAVLDDPLASRHIGETVLEPRTGASLKWLVRTLGSPAALLRSVAKASAKFSTNYTCQASSVGRREAVIVNRLHDGYEPNVLDCEYTMGLLTTVPSIFGLPPATVEHDECQVRGAPACVYRLRWRSRSRLPWRAARARHGDLVDQLRVVTERYEGLLSTLADLVSPADVDTVLSRITRRAADAVRAQQFLLFVIGDDGRPTLHFDGMTAEEAARLADEIRSADRPPVDASMLVADVASSRRAYGQLVALYGSEHSFFPEEAGLLATYARQAAVALDAATAFTEVSERGETAQSLLDLARTLATAQTTADVAQHLAEAVPGVIGGHRCGVMVWDPVERQLATFGTSRNRDDGHPLAVISEGDSPTLSTFVHTLSPQRVSTTSADPFVREVLETRGLEESIVVPIVSEGELLGAITASRSADEPPFVDERLLSGRLSGLADHAALAFAKVRLLEQEREAVDSLRREEAWNKHLAYHDALTGLPNGRSFASELDDALGAAGADGSVAVLFCDLDRFKNVNDSLGHARGDELLCHAAERLARCVDGAVVARLGGDEFAVLVRHPDAAAVGERMARSVIDVLGSPFTVGGLPLFVSASIGIAVHPVDGRDRATLLMNADTAMYDAKRTGRNGYRRYQAAMNAESKQLLALESDLHAAVGNGELLLYFQPQVDARTHEIRSVEALVRWQHREKGLLLPGQFIPLAEESGLILAIDEWVLRAACDQGRAWDDAGIRQVPIAVNLSVRQIERPELPDLVADAIASAGLVPSRLEIEVAEGAAVRDTGVVRRLRADGFPIALDDFGTGYSLPGYLKQFPVDRIKIDRSFVAGLPGDRFDRAIVESTIRMAHDLGIQITAEGVDDDAQAAFLAAHGSDLLQGHLFAGPLPPAQLAARLGPRRAGPLVERGADEGRTAITTS